MARCIVCHGLSEAEPRAPASIVESLSCLFLFTRESTELRCFSLPMRQPLTHRSYPTVLRRTPTHMSPVRGRDRRCMAARLGSSCPEHQSPGPRDGLEDDPRDKLNQRNISFKFAYTAIAKASQRLLWHCGKVRVHQISHRRKIPVTKELRPPKRGWSYATF